MSKTLVAFYSRAGENYFGGNLPWLSKLLGHDAEGSIYVSRESVFCRQDYEAVLYT